MRWTVTATIMILLATMTTGVGAAPATPAAQAALVFSRAAELERAELACGPRAALSEADKLVLLTARNNAQAALEPESYATLNGTAASNAVTAAAAPNFCAKARGQKRGSLAAVRRAGAKLGKMRR